MTSKEPTENISVSMPMTLLAILDYYCRENDLNRSQAVNRAVRLYLGTLNLLIPEKYMAEGLKIYRIRSNNT